MTKNTLILISNKINIKSVKIFYYYRTRQHDQSKIGYFTYNSIRKLKYSSLLPVRRRTTLRGLIINTKQQIKRLDSTTRKFRINKILLIRKNFNLIGSRNFGLGILEIRRRKYLTYFNNNI